MPEPVKPFPSYKWRWLSVLPSEGLLKASVFLGVLRALDDHQGEPYRSVGLYEDLQRVQAETGTDVTLARDPERNLFRNSGQYWRGTGLVAPITGEIGLTELGRNVAQGRISRDDFVTLMVRNTVLPNPLTYGRVELQRWRNAGLRIKPFELILAVMNSLGRSFGIGQAFLTPEELISIVIPLAGAKSAIADIAQNVREHRLGNLNVSSWPNCAPQANDRRLAREFLLFLENFGVCRTSNMTDRYAQRFLLDQVLDEEVQPDIHRSFLEDAGLVDEEVAMLGTSEILAIVERRRILTNSIERPGQRRFRQGVLLAASSRCVLTDETTSEVLEAAHIIPVEHGGVDGPGNGLCLRVDIHRLYDKGRIRIRPNGDVTLNEHLNATVSYSGLPKHIAFPRGINLAYVAWRERYL